MPRFAANLSMMFTEHDFLDRFAQAQRFRDLCALPAGTPAARAR